MKKRNFGSLEYYEVSRGKDAMLSIGKLHGNETRSKYGILRALETIDKNPGSISYVAVPEVNPAETKKYNGINLNRDFAAFQSAKTWDLSKIVEMYEPKLIVDHHDNLEEAEGFIAMVSNPNPYESLELRLAKRLVNHICIEKAIMKACTNILKAASDSSSLPQLDYGVYQMYGNDTLTGTYGGIVIEVDAKLVDKRTAISIHKECDIFLKSELEKLADSIKK